jgi:hypothetical protein
MDASLRVQVLCLQQEQDHEFQLPCNIFSGTYFVMQTGGVYYEVSGVAVRY